MSSPFRYFRKHTKAFMAVAAVLCMFIFVVGGAIGGGSGGGQQAEADSPVATWNGGSLDQSQLNSLIAHRLITDDFLGRVFVQGGGTSQYDFPMTIPPLLLQSRQPEQIETEVIGTEVVASLAKKAGISVSDNLIVHYINEIGLKKVDREQLEGILKSLGQGNARTNEGIIFGTLRKLLAAHFYRQMYADASMVVLPQQRWDDWRRVNERISIQAAAIPVDKFLAEVPEPTDAQLEMLFNEFKDFDPGRFLNVGGRELPVPTPGFAEPRRVRLQYLKGTIADRAEKLLDQISEEDIAYYYEQHKATDFLKMDAPLGDAAGASSDSDAASTPPATEAAAPETTTPPADAPAGEPAAETPPTTPEPPAEPAAEPAPAAETPADSTAPEEPVKPAKPAAEGEPSSAVRPASPFRLAAFQTTPAEATEEATPAEEPAATEPPAEKTETPAATEPTATADATTPAEDAAAADTAPAVTEPAAAPAAKPDLYEPLDKVRDDIRRALARDKAITELDRIMGEATAQLQSEYNSYGSNVVEAKELKKKTPNPPAKLADLTWLAEKEGLTYEKMSPLTVRELFETPVGKAGDAASQRVTVTQAAFINLQLYEPFLANELEGDWYIVMKTEDTPRRIPEFKEVRDQVVKAWKQQQAAKLAEKKAQELAAEIEKSSAPFDQFFFADRGYDVTKQTAFFSWRDYPTGRPGTGAPPGLSDIPELKNIGPEFMEAAFGLDDNKTVGLLNFDHSTAYVIRLDRKQWSDDELKKLFLEEEGSWPGRYDMMNEHYSIFNNAVETEILEQRAGLKFDEDWLARRAERIQNRR